MKEQMSREVKKAKEKQSKKPEKSKKAEKTVVEEKTGKAESENAIKEAEETKNYDFISESVVSTPKELIRGSKWRMVALVLCLAVFFGILASLSYALSNGVIDYIARKNSDAGRNPIDLGSVNNGQSVSNQAIVTDVSQLAEIARKSVVEISAVTETGGGIFSDMLTNSEEYSGIVIFDDGKNYYVLSEYASLASAGSLRLKFSGGASTEGRIVGYDTELDIAVILVKYEDYYMEDFSEVRTLEFAPQGSVVVGSPVMAIGAPNGIVGSIDYDIVTSEGNESSVADISLNICTTGMKYCDKSSGVVINMEGQICGIITDTYEEEGLFSFMSTDNMLPLVEQLANNASLLYTGAVCENIPEDVLKKAGCENGIYVNKVEEGSPADEAGMRSGDIIVSSDETVIKSVDDYTKLIYQAGYEGKLELHIKRNSSEKDITIVVEK